MTCLQIAPIDYRDDAQGAALVEILDEYARLEVIGGKPLGEDVRRELIPALRAVPQARVLLAWLGGEVIGAAVCLLGFSTFAARPVLNIHDLAVRKAARGQGAGGALLEAAAELARREGCASMTLEVSVANEAAQRLYIRHGFEPGDPAKTAEWFFRRKL